MKRKLLRTLVRLRSSTGSSMQQSYEDVDPDDLILRDDLAADRTLLANERTFLAYIRTALALFVGGATLVHFFDAGWAWITGWIMIPIAPVIMGFGIRRYIRVTRTLRRLR